MDDFDLGNLDKFDFDSAETEAKRKAEEREAKEESEIKELREGANDCTGGSCSI